MTNYTPHTIGSLLDRLKEMDRATKISGLSAESTSYRGYYEHVALVPGQTTARKLEAALRKSLGKNMTGYKGGDYTIKEDCRVFVAEYGDIGPQLVDITDAGAIVTVEEIW